MAVALPESCLRTNVVTANTMSTPTKRRLSGRYTDKFFITLTPKPGCQIKAQCLFTTKLFGVQEEEHKKGNNPCRPCRKSHKNQPHKYQNKANKELKIPIRETIIPKRLSQRTISTPPKQTAFQGFDRVPVKENAAAWIQANLTQLVHPARPQDRPRIHAPTIRQEPRRDQDLILFER